MDFAFDIVLTEQDYEDFNLFTALGSEKGKKQFLKHRIFLTLFAILLGVAVLWVREITDISYIIAYIVLIFAIIFLTYKPYYAFAIKRSLKNIKKNGKMPFSPNAKMIFSEDHFIEITQTNKSEYKYEVIESVYLVNDNIFYIFISSVRAFLLPVASFESKEQYEAFIAFIEEKAVPVTKCDYNRSPHQKARFVD